MMGHLAYQAAIEHVNTLRAAAERQSGRTVHPGRRLRPSKARLWLRHHRGIRRWLGFPGFSR